MQNQLLMCGLSATVERPRPGAFAIGFRQSRPAARALFESRLGKAKRLDFVLSVVGKRDIFNPPSVGTWGERVDGTMTRISRIPWGMNIEEAERMVL